MLTLNSKLFARVALAQSTEETRYYLKGVHVSAHPRGEGVILAATDGHMLIAAHDPTGTPPAQDGGLIVGLGKEGLKSAAKGTELTIDPATGAATVPGLWLSPASVMVDGNYPDWRRVLPTSPEALAPTAARFDHKLLATLAKALSDGATQPLHIRGAHADGPHLVTGNTSDPIFGICMPMRHAPAAGDTLPAWL